VDSFNANTERIAEGIVLRGDGQASVSKVAGEALFSLALQMESRVPYPVDIQHVLAALIMASRGGEITDSCSLVPTDMALLEVLQKHVTTLFERFEGRVCPDDRPQ
jgi:hypothetical protein